jgi:hypothetical protein
MSKLDCEKKLAKLDESRDIVRLEMADQIVRSRELAASLKSLVADMDDAAALKDLQRLLKEYDTYADPSVLEGLIDSWEAEAKKFRQEVLDAVLDKTKRDKNLKELATTCVPIKDYVEAAQSEIKAGRAVVVLVRAFIPIAKAFEKAVRQQAPTP